MNIDVTTLAVSIPSDLLADIQRIAQQERRPQDNAIAHLLHLGIVARAERLACHSTQNTKDQDTRTEG